MTGSAESLLDRLAAVVRTRLPSGISAPYFDGFLTRNRPALVSILDQQLGSPRAANDPAAPPEHWTPAPRTRANLDAMRIAAARHPDEMSPEDRRVRAGCSGRGGLSIEAATSQFPPGFSAPEVSNPTHLHQFTPPSVPPLTSVSH